MSTHIHLIVYSDDPRSMIYTLIQSITQYFNSKYGRKGRLFDKKSFSMAISGPRHVQMALNYALRQGLHHGLCDTPFAYPDCTCNEIFIKQRGMKERVLYYSNKADLKDFFPKNADFPDFWCADENGILLRGCFEEIQLVENWYGTARNYIFSMVRKSTDEWIDEQKQDNSNEPLITLLSIEPSYSPQDITKMYSMEGNAKFISRGPSDRDICSIIDSQILCERQSVYTITEKRKDDIIKILQIEYGIKSQKQIMRCLAIR